MSQQGNAGASDRNCGNSLNECINRAVFQVNDYIVIERKFHDAQTSKVTGAGVCPVHRLIGR